MPSPARRVIGRARCALNAFGLFAAEGFRESKATHAQAAAMATRAADFLMVDLRQ